MHRLPYVNRPDTNCHVSSFRKKNTTPTHPATHGIFENVLEIDGEKVLSATQNLGYIHRAFEKIAERRPYGQIQPLTDRLNYCSAPINNIGWQTTVEKLLGLTMPKRVDYLRVMLMEFARIADHLVCNSIVAVDTGALTPFTYVFQIRERIYEIYEAICGARLTTNIGRIGGFERNLTDDCWKKVHALMADLPKALNEFETLLNRNRIFMDRCIGAGPISAERALNYGFTGPNLRATGVDYDVRVHSPYCSYEDFEFDIPVGTNGDVYDRFMVRNGEMWQSYKIIQQAIEKLKDLDPSVYHADVPAYYLPEKKEVYTKMEALIYHFKIVMGEIDIKAGEVYHSVEGANGELGFYLISDGGRAPFRLHFRRPCFIYYQAYPEMIKDGLLSDAVIALSSMNVIAGELDA
jgi:NADH-quinone oxidoreductase subunit D